MTAPIDGNVANGDLAALLQGNGLVARAYGTALQVAGTLGIFVGKSLAVNHTVPGYRHVFLTLCPDKRVVEIGMATILILWKAAERLALIIGFHRRRCCQNGTASGQMQVDVAFQTDAA